jgi:hypothetical protein
MGLSTQCPQVQLLGTLDTIDVKYDSRIRGLIGVCGLSNVNLVRLPPSDKPIHLAVTEFGPIVQDFLRVGCLFPDKDELAYYATAKMYLLGPPAVCVGLLAVYGFLRLVPRVIPVSKNYPIFGDKTKARRLCVNVLFLLLELTYTPIVLGATGLFMCKHLTEQDVARAPTALYDAPHLDCKTEDWYRQLPISLIVIIVWGLLMPLVLGTVVYKCSTGTMLTTAEKGKEMFSLTGYGYKPKHAYWEWYECLKRLGWFALIAGFSGDGFYQALYVLLAVVCSIGVMALVQPFTNRLISLTHIVTDCLLLTIVASGLARYKVADEDDPGDWQAQVLTITSLILAAGSMAGVLFVLVLELGAVAHEQHLRHQSILFMERPLLSAYRMWNDAENSAQLLKTSVFKRLVEARKSLFGSSSVQLAAHSLEMTENDVLGMADPSQLSPGINNGSPLPPRRTGMGIKDAATGIVGTAATVFLTLEATGDLQPNETQQFQRALVSHLQQYSEALRSTNVSVRRLGTLSPMVLVVSLAGSRIDGESLALQLSTDVAAGLVPTLAGYAYAPPVYEYTCHLFEYERAASSGLATSMGP